MEKIVSFAGIGQLLRRYILIAVAAVHILSVGLLVFVNRPVAAAAATVTPGIPLFNASVIHGTPVRISVPDLGLQLPIELGQYVEAIDEWTLSPFNAHFADITAPANNAGGNTFIYGHNNNKVFGPLKKLRAGSQIEIETDNGNKFYYKLAGSRVVQPNDVSVFEYEGRPILTIQTCTGTWHEKRELYTFSFSHVIESNQSQLVRDEANRAELKNLVAALMSPSITLDTTNNTAQYAETEQQESQVAVYETSDLPQQNIVQDENMDPVVVSIKNLIQPSAHQIINI